MTLAPSEPTLCKLLLKIVHGNCGNNLHIIADLQTIGLPDHLEPDIQIWSSYGLPILCHKQCDCQGKAPQNDLRWRILTVKCFIWKVVNVP